MNRSNGLVPTTLRDLYDRYVNTCPTCGGVARVLLPTGFSRCVNEVVKTVVPPGLGGNHAGAPMPVRGERGTLYVVVEPVMTVL